MMILDEINKVGKWLRCNYWGLSGGLRSIITALIASVIGAVFLALGNRVALYLFAINHDLRVPIAGIPHLDVAVLILSFILFISLLIGGFALHSSLVLISKSIIRCLRIKSTVVQRGIKVTVGVIALAASIFWFSSQYAQEFFAVKFNQFEEWIDFSFPNTFGLVIPGMFAVAAFVLILNSLTRENSGLRWAVVILTLIAALIAFGSLFQPEHYSAFLRKIKYGGGVPVSISYRVDDKQVETISGDLYILTKQQVVIKNLAGESIEITRPNVLIIVYKSVKTAPEE